MRIRQIILFGFFTVAIYSQNAKNKIQPFSSCSIQERIVIDTLSVIYSKKPKEASIHFHHKKCDIYFDKNQIVRLWEKSLHEMDSTYKVDKKEWRRNDLNELTVGLDIFNRQEGWEFNIDKFQDSDIITEIRDKKLSAHQCNFIYYVCSELLDEGKFKILSSKKTQTKIIKARVYIEHYKSATTFIKYYLKGMIEIWTGLPIIHDDFL